MFKECAMPTRSLKAMPTPPGRLLTGHFQALWNDGPRTMLEGHRDHGDHVRFRFGPFSYVSLRDLEDVRKVLVTDAQRYTKSKVYTALKLLLGEGLVTSEGAMWQRQRKLSSPAFRPRAVASFTEAMGACTRDLGERWRGLGDGAELDVHDEMMRLTLRIVGMTLVSKDLEGEARAFGEALSTVLEYINDVGGNPLASILWIPTAKNRRTLAARDTLDAVIQGIIDERRRAGSGPGDLLDMLMAARDEDTGEGMDARQLRDELMTLVVAGHETTSNALSWTWYLLSQHPEHVQRLRAEVDEVLGDRLPTPEDLAKLEHTERVLKESMRVYPPVWAVEREPSEAVEVGGYRLPKGTMIGISPYVLHRDPQHWPDPERFDPDRFTPERSAGRPRYAYLPFGAGPRVCIGAGFALTEAKAILAMLVRRFDLERVPGQAVHMEPGITLRPKHGLRMRLRVRGAAQAQDLSSVA